jgi:hypothetical protein
LQRWEPSDAYLSGNVRRKLAAARLAGLDKNVKELEAVQPPAWTADQVSPLIGSNWIQPKVYEDFAKHTCSALIAPQSTTPAPPTRTTSSRPNMAPTFRRSGARRICRPTPSCAGC